MKKVSLCGSQKIDVGKKKSGTILLMGRKKTHYSPTDGTAKSNMFTNIYLSSWLRNQPTVDQENCYANSVTNFLQNNNLVKCSWGKKVTVKFGKCCTAESGLRDA